jgi:predicted nuclease of predicted toxin-antitoxin system
MHLLLDECLPARLRRDLTGHETLTVPRAGWAGIKNGKLLRLIADAGKFEVFITMDKSLPHQQQLKGLPFAVVVLRAKSNRFEDTHPLMPEFLRRLPEFQPGQLYVLSSPDL